jgi:tryptophanyl-tRNA synthetase
LENFVAPIRTRRNELANDKAEILKILQKGSEKTEVIAAKTLAEVKQAMKIAYFG